jgi:sugar phosphate isomerase/epimerase
VAESELGVVLDSFGQPIKDALQSAASLSLRRLEMPAVANEVDPKVLSRSGRRHLARYVSSLGLRMSALGSDTGGKRFGDSAGAEQALDKTREIMAMAAEMHVPIVTTHLGRFASGSKQERLLSEVLVQIAEWSDRTGTLVAFETGGTDPNTIAGLLNEIRCPTLGVCYDPASLLIDGFDALAGVDPLADKILHARARDAIGGHGDRPGHEADLGEGEVDFAEYLAALDQAGYRHAPFIRRTPGQKPMDEIADARDHLNSLIR